MNEIYETCLKYLGEQNILTKKALEQFEQDASVKKTSPFDEIKALKAALKELDLVQLSVIADNAETSEETRELINSYFILKSANISTDAVAFAQAQMVLLTKKPRKPKTFQHPYQIGYGDNWYPTLSAALRAAGYSEEMGQDWKRSWSRAMKQILKSGEAVILFPGTDETRKFIQKFI